MLPGDLSRVENRIRSRLIRALGVNPDRVQYLEGDATPAVASLQRLRMYADDRVHSYIHPVTRRRVSHAIPRRWMYRLGQAVISAETSYVYTSTGKLIAESLSWPADAAMVHAPAPPRWINKVGVSGPVIFMPSDGYYHWLIEDLPAFLAAFREFPEAHVFVRAGAPDYVMEALSLLGVDAVPFSGNVLVSDLILLGRGPFTGWGQPEDIEQLRHLASLQSDSESTGRRIYVSRRGSRRSPANEAEVERVCASHGLDVLRSEDLTLREQIVEFRRARLIVGPHGAGLSNQAWSSSPLTVVELIDPNYFVTCYVTLAGACGNDYGYLTSRSSNIWEVPLEILDARLDELEPM